MMNVERKAWMLNKKLISALLAIVIALSCFAFFPQEAYAAGETPGTDAYYNARWEDAKRATDYKDVGTSYTDYNGAAATTTNAGPWNLNLDWGNTCSLPWNGTAIAPTTTTTVTNLTGTTVSAYIVYTAEQLRWCIANHKSFKLMNDIDLNGYTGKTWAEPAAATTAWVADGNGHTIYNCYATFTIFGSTSDFHVKSLRVKNSFICNTSNTSNEAASFFVKSRKSGNVHVSNSCWIHRCAIEDSLIYMYAQKGWAQAAGFNNGGRNSVISDCYTNNLNIYNFSKDKSSSCGASIALSTDGCTISDTFVMNGSVIGNVGHNGGFISCMYGNTTVSNCFNSNVNVYGSESAGSFVGVFHQGTHRFNNCFVSGKVEGTKELGGFAGSYGSTAQGTAMTANAYYTNCYSTSLVGVQKGQNANIGGFIGSNNSRRSNYTINFKADYTNCYAAGEVGNISTNSYNNRGTTDSTVAGFIGYRAKASNDDQYYNCYYDGQMTGMRNWALGVGYDNNNNPLAFTSDDLQTKWKGSHDVKSVLTSDTDKCGTGLTSAPSSNGVGNQGTTTVNRSFTGFKDNSKWTFTNGYYPQLKVFTNPTTFTNANWMTQTQMNNLVKACSLASASTAKLNTWDEDYNGNPLPKDTYDTVRDVTSKAPLTNTANVSWDRCGVTGEDTLATGTGATTEVFGTTKDVVTLEKDPTDGWQVKDPYPGVDWLRATVTVNGQRASRAFRICPTDGLWAGAPNTTVDVGTRYDHADDMKMVYTTGARWAADTEDMTYGVYPDVPLAAAQNSLLSTGGLKNKSALTALYAQTGQNDVYTGVNVGNMQRTSTNINSYPAATATTGNLLNTTIQKATGVDSAGNVTYGSVNLNGNLGQKFNGNLNFVGNDAGRYLITYDWSLNDGRYLTGTKGVTVRPTPADITIRVEDETGTSVSDASGLDAYTGSTPPTTISGTSAADTVGAPLNDPAGVSWTEPSKYSIIALEATLYDGSMIPHTVRINNPTVGSTVTIPMRYYLNDTDANGNAVTYSTTVNQTYTVTKTGDVYSLVFDKTGTKAEPKSIHGLSYDLSDVQSNIEVVLVVKRTDITFKKVEPDGTGLAGAGFTLYECTNNTQGHTHGNGCTWNTSSPYKAEVRTATNGQATITGVNPGRTYIMVETTVPTGMKDPGTNSYIVVNVAADGTYTMTGAGYFAENGAITQEQGGTYMIQNAYGIAEIRLKKIIGNYADFGDALKDNEFIFHLSGDVIVSTSLKHGETSKKILHVVDGASDTFNVMEVVPMEFDKNYTVSTSITHADGTTETQTGRTVEIRPGDNALVTITNTFEHKGYFKAWDWVKNIFAG